MNNLNFVVGKQYKLVDVNAGNGDIVVVLNLGILRLPDDSTFTCHAVDDKGNCLSQTEGVTNSDWITTGPGHMCATKADLNAGVFVEVTDGTS